MPLLEYVSVSEVNVVLAISVENIIVLYLFQIIHICLFFLLLSHLILIWTKAVYLPIGVTYFGPLLPLKSKFVWLSATVYWQWYCRYRFCSTIIPDPSFVLVCVSLVALLFLPFHSRCSSNETSFFLFDLLYYGGLTTNTSISISETDWYIISLKNLLLFIYSFCLRILHLFLVCILYYIRFF